MSKIVFESPFTFAFTRSSRVFPLQLCFPLAKECVGGGTWSWKRINRQQILFTAFSMQLKFLCIFCYLVLAALFPFHVAVVVVVIIIKCVRFLFRK